MGYTKEDLYKLDAIEIYKLLIEGKEVKSFPHGFWKDADAKKIL